MPANVFRFLANTSLPAGEQNPYNLTWTYFSGETLAVYYSYLQFAGKIRSVTLKPGAISFDFPKFGKIGSEEHQAGQEIFGDGYESTVYTVTRDLRPLVSAFELDDFDLRLSDIEVRSDLTNKVGMELAEKSDLKRVKTLLKASRTGARGEFPGGGWIASGGIPNGAALTNAAFGAGTTAAATGILDAIEAFLLNREQNAAPKGGYFCCVSPQDYYAIRKLGTLVTTVTATNPVYQPLIGRPGIDPNKPISQDAGYEEAIMHLGMPIIRSNFIDKLGNTTGLEDAKYAGDYSKTKGLIWHPQAAGFVEQGGIEFETDRNVKTGSDFAVGKIINGGGVLQPILACELATP